MNPPATTWYEPLGEGRFLSTEATAGPWSPDAQHGGPPAALLGRALETLEDGNDGSRRAVGRFTMDLLGPVPVQELQVTTSVLRPGRTVSLRQAELSDPTGRVLARAQGWAFPQATPDGQGTPDGQSAGAQSADGHASTDAPGPGSPASALEPLEHGPRDGRHEEPPASWSRGYLDSMEWQWIEGAVTRPGAAVVWMRPLLSLVPGEEMTPLQRLLACVDSASGASAVLDPDEWNFLNTELTVHVLRPPVGEWICLRAETTIGTGAVGLAAAEVYDELGLVARSAQALLVTPRRR